MSSQDFKRKFDRAGRYLASDGVEDVLFVTRSRKEYRGKLHFQNGLCASAEMDGGGGDWSWRDDSPLREVGFVLKFVGGATLWVAVKMGQISFPKTGESADLKKKFLANLRTARSLLGRTRPCATGIDVDVDVDVDDATASPDRLSAAIWLTPRSVAEFDPGFFEELGPDRQAELQAAVEAFRSIAERVAPTAPPTQEQFAEGKTAFESVIRLFESHFPGEDSESVSIEGALAEAVGKFPSWVVNWDYELGPDSVGADALWVRLFVDERSANIQHLGRYVSDFASEVRTALNDVGIARWPYVRMRSSAEHRAGV